jgi:MoxR-like ATPase
MPTPPDAAIITAARRRLDPLFEAMDQVLVGQRSLVEGLLTALLCRGHVLLEGVPGLAKTLSVRSLAAALDLKFQRIQFTPDLLPADVVGTQIYNPRTAEFTLREGPVFANVLLADEINRAPAKVQSALLEAMQERQVTLGDESRLLPEPFIVLATQNPVEHEGTYPLPEAQLDRFLMKLVVDYPSRENELAILDRHAIATTPSIKAVLNAAAIRELQCVVDAIHVELSAKAYIVDIVRASRTPAEFGLQSLSPLIELGASPRGSLALLQAAKASAFLAGRGHVMPDDVKARAKDALRHRITPSFEAEAENITRDEILSRILGQLKVP